MRRTVGSNGAGAVLLAMLALAILIGLGNGAIEAYEQRGIDAATPAADERELAANLPESGDAPSTENEASGGEAVEPEPEGEPGPRVAAPAGVTAQAVHAFDPATGEVLVAEAADERMPIGSIVKIATALVTLEYAGLEEEVVIDESDLVDYTVYSNMGLVPGDTLTVEQLLMGLLVPSGSDAARALARYVGGHLSRSADPATARAAFVDAMNIYARQIGLENTHFANAGGNDAEGSYSTARDVSILASRLLATPALAAIVAMPGYEFAGGNGTVTYTGFNTNAMLGEDGVVGIKTGSTGSAGGCVVLARRASSGEVIVLTLLGSDLAYNELNQIVTDARWDDARLLFAAIDG